MRLPSSHTVAKYGTITPTSVVHCSGERKENQKKPVTVILFGPESNVMVHFQTPGACLVMVQPMVCVLEVKLLETVVKFITERVVEDTSVCVNGAVKT